METILTKGNMVAHVVVFFGGLILFFRLFTQHTRKAGVIGGINWFTLKMCLIAMLAMHAKAVLEYLVLGTEWTVVENLLSYTVIPLLGIWIEYGNGYKLKEGFKKEYQKQRGHE